MSKAIGRYGDLRCPLGLICFLLSFACFIFFVNKNQNQTTISNCLEWPERAIPTDDERNKVIHKLFCLYHKFLPYLSDLRNSLQKHPHRISNGFHRSLSKFDKTFDAFNDEEGRL